MPPVQIRWALFWRLLLFATCPLLLLGTTCAALVYLHRIDETKQQDELALIKASQAVDASLQRPRQMFLQATEFLNSKSLRGENAAAYLSSILKSDPELEALFLLDGNGKVELFALQPFLATHAGDLRALDLSRVFPSTRKQDPGRWVCAGNSPWTGRPLASIVQPVDEQLLVGVLDFGHLSGRYLNTAHHSLALLDHEGRPLAGALGWPPAGDINLASSPIFQQAHAGELSSGTVQLEQQSYTLSAVPVGTSGWVVGLARPAGMHGSISLLKNAGGLLLIGVLLCVWLSLRFSRRMAEPFRELLGASPAVANPPRYRELQQFADTLQKLNADVRAHQDAMEKLARTLGRLLAPAQDRPPGQALADIAAQLQEFSGAPNVLILERPDADSFDARILAARTSIPLSPDFTFDLRCNPCRELKPGALLHIPSKVQRDYPESPLLRLLGAESFIAVPLSLTGHEIAGQIALIFSDETVPDPVTSLLLHVFAVRASVELHRAILQQNAQEEARRREQLEVDAGDLIRRCTADGTVTYVNDACGRYFGQPREALLGHSLLSTIEEIDREAFLSALTQLSIEKPTLKLECLGRNGAGELRWQRWTIRALVNSSGRVTEYQTTGTDITASRNLEVQITELQGRLDQLSHVLPHAFWLTDWTTQQVIYFNPAAQKLWELSATTPSEGSMAWTNAICEQDRSRIARRFLLAGAEGSYCDEFTVSAPEGSRRLRLRVYALRDPENQVYRVAALAEQIATTN